MGAIKELKSEPVFKLTNLLAYRSLGDMQLFGGTLEAAGLAYDPEAPECVEWRKFDHMLKRSLCLIKKLSFVSKAVSPDNTRELEQGLQSS